MSPAWLIASFILLLCTAVDRSVGQNSPTPQMRDIVVGRCLDYQNKVLGSDSSNWKNCTTIWEAFYGAYADKNPCSITSDDYMPFFDEVGMAEIVDKSIFWSGTYRVAHSYAEENVRYTTLEDTMPGYLTDGLNWCGIGCSVCNYMTPYWALASTTFADKARGVVRVILNGSRVDDNGNHIPAYSDTSFFAQYELPNLQVDQVTELLIIVVHTVDGEILERCGTESIKELESDATERGLKISCYDDPDDIRHLLCVDYPLSRECLFLYQSSSMGNGPLPWIGIEGKKRSKCLRRCLRLQ